jgi:O-antigen/teichoic acid export membrane protein
MYYGAEKVIGLLVLSTIAYGAYLILNIGLMVAKKTSYTSISVAAGAILNLVLNFVLVPRFGIMGAAVATLISYCVSVAAVYWFANKWNPIDYRIRRIGKLILLSVAAMLIASIIDIESSVALDVLFSVFLFGIFLFGIRRFFFRIPHEE